MTQSSQRPLSGLERQFYQQNLVGSTNIVSALIYEGRIDSEKLRNALGDLLKVHPVLNQRIIADPFLRLAPSESNTLPFEERATNNWREDFERELNRSYPDRPIHLILLHSSDGPVLFLCLNHAICDGMSTLILTRDLLRLYSGETLKVVPHGEGVEARFPREFRGLRGFFKALRFIFVLAKCGPALQIGTVDATRHTGHLGFRLDTLDVLNAKAKAEGANVFALISAVVLKTVHQLYGEGRDQNLSLNTPVSLRAATGVRDDEIGVFIAGHLGLYSIRTERDTYDLARACFQHLKKGVSLGRPFLLTLLARGARRPKPPKIPEKNSSHRPTVSISNLGRLERLPLLEGATLKELHAVSAQSIKDPFAFVLLSYEGTTFIDLQYSKEKMKDEEARALIEGVRQNLAVLSVNSR